MTDLEKFAKMQDMARRYRKWEPYETLHGKTASIKERNLRIDYFLIDVLQMLES